MTMILWCGASTVLVTILLHYLGAVEVIAKITYFLAAVVGSAMVVLSKFLLTSEFTRTQGWWIMFSGAVALVIFVSFTGLPRFIILAHEHQFSQAKYERIAKRLKYRTYDVVRSTTNHSWVSEVIQKGWLDKLLVTPGFISRASEEFINQLRDAQEFEGLVILPLSDRTEHASSLQAAYPWHRLVYNVPKDKSVPGYNEPNLLRQWLA